MSTLTLAAGRPTLADRLFTRRLTTDIVLVTAGALLTSVLAQIAIPLWPVPITMQTFAVLFVGATLGASRGALSLALYAVLGLVGLPVFAPNADHSHTTGLAAILGPTGGFIIAFILAAAFVGWLAQREWDHKILKTAVAFLGGSAIMYLIGLPWLFVGLSNLGTAVIPDPLGTTLTSGFLVFVPGDILKAIAAGLLLPGAWRALNRKAK